MGTFQRCIKAKTRVNGGSCLRGLNDNPQNALRSFFFSPVHDVILFPGWETCMCQPCSVQLLKGIWLFVVSLLVNYLRISLSPTAEFLWWGFCKIAYFPCNILTRWKRFNNKIKCWKQVNKKIIPIIKFTIRQYKRIRMMSEWVNVFITSLESNNT